MVCPRGFHASDRYTEARTFRARHSQLPSLDIKCDRVYLFSSVSGLGLGRVISPQRSDQVIPSLRVFLAKQQGEMSYEI
ncbi:hypothetical protein [Tychonema sp. BBK16]|uniref:hypothetical protein n=1 Tax=Tychonema sp. BBK16 TaxID=2699888 RepID=UPI001F3C1C72|nr:hypothetical protein [Tychonema sp. BBK16]MCF6373549.1 hypothetical protein [Tychonema sp. BBK16]